MSSIVLVEQSSAPTTPATGKVAVFVDTNGDLSWKDDAGNVVKIAAAGSYTLTIPASGTAALRDVAQTFSAQQTFSQAPIAPGMKPAADSTTAIQLMNAAGTAVATVDTTNSRLLMIGAIGAQLAASGNGQAIRHVGIPRTTTIALANNAEVTLTFDGDAVLLAIEIGYAALVFVTYLSATITKLADPDAIISAAFLDVTKSASARTVTITNKTGTTRNLSVMSMGVITAIV